MPLAPSAPLPQTSYPRIYELFPRLAGKINKWDGVVSDAQNMGFNWIWTNPFNLTCRTPKLTGEVGSLYSISDHDMLDAAFSTAKIGARGVTNMERLVMSYLVNSGHTNEKGETLTGEARWKQATHEVEYLVKRFTTMKPPLCDEREAKHLLSFAEKGEQVAKGWYESVVKQDREAILKLTAHAHEKKMKVMADLVLNHVSLDHPLVQEDEKKLERFYNLKKDATPITAPDDRSFIEWRASEDEPPFLAHRVEMQTKEGATLVYYEKVGYDKKGNEIPDRNQWELLQVEFPGEREPVVPLFRRFVTQYDRGLRGPESLVSYRENDQVSWDDVAQFNFDHAKVREFCMGKDGKPGFFQQLTHKYLDLGFDGFRADAAYKIPGKIWDKIIDDSRAYAHKELGRPVKDEEGKSNEIAFLAEIVGGQDKSEHLDTGNKKWDWATSSLRWWLSQEGHIEKAQADGAKDWHTGSENDLINRIARHGSVDFPESHDTERSAERYAVKYKDAPKLMAKALARDYAIAALGSSNGLFMPMGYEFGLQKKLSVFEDAEARSWAVQKKESGIDITKFIQQMNAVKKAIPVTPGISKEVMPNHRAGADDVKYDLDSNIALFRRQFRGEPGDANAGSLVIAVNLDPEKETRIDIATMNRVIGRKPGEAYALCPGPRCPDILKELWLDDKARIVWVPPIEPKKAKPSSKVAPEVKEAMDVFAAARDSFRGLGMKFVQMGPKERAIA